MGTAASNVVNNTAWTSRIVRQISFIMSISHICKYVVYCLTSRVLVWYKPVVFQMRRQRGSNLGLLLLATQVFRLGLDNIPPVTLATLGLNVYLFLFPLKPLLQVRITIPKTVKTQRTHVLKTNTNPYVTTNADDVIRYFLFLYYCRRVWVFERHTGTETGIVCSYLRFTTSMTCTCTSTWPPFFGKASIWRGNWEGLGSHTCCLSSLCSPDWPTCSWRWDWRTWRMIPRTVCSVRWASQVSGSVEPNKEYLTCTNGLRIDSMNFSSDVDGLSNTSWGVAEINVVIYFRCSVWAEGGE